MNVDPKGWLARAREFTRSRAGRWSMAAVAVLLVALGARSLLSGIGATAAPEPARIRKDDLVMTVDVAGELAAVRTIEIGAPSVRDLWDFKISFLAVESAQVKKGQPVIAFDAQPLEKALEEKRAEAASAAKQIERKETDLGIQIKAEELALAEAEARLGKAQLKTDVPEELKGRIDALDARLEREDAQQEVLTHQAKIEALRIAGEADLRAFRSQRDRASARVEELLADIRAMQISAPQDGIVIYRTGWRDEKKKVGDSTWVGEKVLELPDLREMKAKGDVDEADAGLVALGQPVKLNLEAHPDLDFTGKVAEIGSTVRRQSWRVPTKVYKIGIHLDRTDPVAMRPAMRFRGEIETERIPGVLLAPRDGIFLRAGGPIAWKKRGSGYVEAPVQLGRRNKRFVEILAGLVEGDEIAQIDIARPAAGRPSGPMAAGL